MSFLPGHQVTSLRRVHLPLYVLGSAAIGNLAGGSRQDPSAQYAATSLCAMLAAAGAVRWRERRSVKLRAGSYTPATPVVASPQAPDGRDGALEGKDGIFEAVGSSTKTKKTTSWADFAGRGLYHKKNHLLGGFCRPWVLPQPKTTCWCV